MKVSKVNLKPLTPAVKPIDWAQARAKLGDKWLLAKPVQRLAPLGVNLAKKGVLDGGR